MFKNKKVEFPVAFELKVIMDSIKSDGESMKILEILFSSLGIKYSEIKKKSSRTGKYNSFSVEVTVSDQALFTMLYDELRMIPEVKLAI
jgi:putative lipoic acid-binding regulatory protein